VSFERGFAEVERAAGAVVKAAGMLGSAAKAMLRAAQDGDMADIGRAAQRMSAATEAAVQEAANARSAWPFAPEREELFLKEEYAAELVCAAEAIGLKIQRRDGLLVAYPSIIRILPSDRAVRLNRTRFFGLRPSKLAAKLKAAQNKKSRGGAQPFLEALHSAYELVAGAEVGGVIPLAKIYKAFTLLPSSGADYSRDDFARDLFTLDRSGINETRSGARASLPASTGTKESRDTFVCVAPDGEIVTYYGIRFTKVQHDSGNAA
jgi:hypothetical protein